MHFLLPGLRRVTKSYRLDTSGRSEDKEAAAIAPIVRKACDVCTVRHALRNPTHLLRRSADCEPYPRLQLDSVTAGRGGRGGCGKIYTCHVTRHATHMQHTCNTTCNTTRNTQERLKKLRDFSCLAISPPGRPLKHFFCSDF